CRRQGVEVENVDMYVDGQKAASDVRDEFVPVTALFPYTTLFRSCSSNPMRPRRGLPPASTACLRCGKRTVLAWTTSRLSILASPDRKSTRLNSSHSQISYAVFCLKIKKLA